MLSPKRYLHEMARTLFSDRYRQLLQALVAERKRVGLTQEELACRLGKPQSFVSKYERAERRLDVEEFLRVADALETDAARLLSALKTAR